MSALPGAARSCSNQHAVRAAAVLRPFRPGGGVEHDVSPRPLRVSLSRAPGSITSFPPLGLEYVAAALRPYARQIEQVNFRHERKPSTQPFLRPDTDLVCYSINWRKNLELIRDDINALPPAVMTIAGRADGDPGSAVTGWRPARTSTP